MIIDNTELEYNETEEKILDYFLGGFSETKEQWAQRVWSCCERHENGEALPRVYAAKQDQTWQQRAIYLWKNKIAHRKEAIKRELKVKDEDLSSIDSHSKYKTRSEKDSEIN